MRLPNLSPTAKGQLWGLLVGGSTALWFADKHEMSLGLFAVGTGVAWVAGEALFGKRLIGASDMKAVALAVVSGLAFPWIGLGFVALLQIMRM